MTNITKVTGHENGSGAIARLPDLHVRAAPGAFQKQENLFKMTEVVGLIGTTRPFGIMDIIILG